MSNSFGFVVVQFLAGLASASNLFLVASGLSIIFGVTRIVNFAHGALYMIGAYIAYTATKAFAAGAIGFWGGVVAAAVAVMAIGVVIEVTLLRRVYRAPELFQLLATFAVVLIVEDLVLLIWGPADRLGPRAPGLTGSVSILGRSFPSYDLLLIVLGPAVLLLLTVLFKRTRWGILVRAATDDREMLAALGVHQHLLFTSVFALGALLAGFAGALQLPRQSVHATMDMQIIVEAFVVVVVGGLGSVTGAYLAAVIIGVLNAFAIAVAPEISLVLAFLVMVIVLSVRPQGLLGTGEGMGRGTAAAAPPLLRPAGVKARASVCAAIALMAAMPFALGDYGLTVLTEVLIFALYAASLHLLLGPAGLISFGHAAFFGLGAYAAALAARHFGVGLPVAVAAGMLSAALGAAASAILSLRLSGVYLAMLTLAFAQIVWTIAYQWYGVTGGDNGILGLWPPAWLASAAAYYWLTLLLAVLALAALRHLVFSPFGLALRGCRDAPVRAGAAGLSPGRLRVVAFVIAGGLAGLAGSLFAFFKGSVFPDVLAIPLSVDGLIMVLLGGINTLTGPIVGAAVYKLLRILLASHTDYWRLVMGVVIVVVVTAFPEGICGAAWHRLAAKVAAGRPQCRRFRYGRPR